jgi:hypothetical protein
MLINPSFWYFKHRSLVTVAFEYCLMIHVHYSRGGHYIVRNDRWFAHLHIQNGDSKRIWILTYSWTGNFLLAWAGQFAGIQNQTMHRFEQYLKILQLYHENSRFPPSFKFWSGSAIQKQWEEVKLEAPRSLYSSPGYNNISQ